MPSIGGFDLGEGDFQEVGGELHGADLAALRWVGT